MRRKTLPLIYSCSGCSSVAQLANDVAISLDHKGKAEMSCIAGVGGGIKSLVDTACSGRPIVAIDGCALNCAVNCLKACDVVPTIHVKLYEHGYKKRIGEKASELDFQTACLLVEQQVEHLS